MYLVLIIMQKFCMGKWSLLSMRGNKYSPYHDCAFSSSMVNIMNNFVNLTLLNLFFFYDCDDE